MACLLVPLTEAIVISCAKGAIMYGNKSESDKIIAFGKKTATLQKMLFGGSALLAIEHIYNGEIVFYPPFLTAMNSPEDTAEMLHEMGTAGVAMAVLITAIWAIAMILHHLLSKKSFFQKTKEFINSKKSGFFALASLSCISAALMWSVDLIGAGENGILVAISAVAAAIFAAIHFSTKQSMLFAKK